MEIKKISWTPKNGMKISYNLNENEESVSYVKKSDAIPTLDFQNALIALTPHLCLLTEYIERIEWRPEFWQEITNSGYWALINEFDVTEIQLTGEVEEEKVIIIGKKELVNKLTIPIKTLKTALYNTDEYEYSGNLAEAVELLVEEAKEFLNGNHQDKPVQLGMQLYPKEEDNDEEDAI